MIARYRYIVIFVTVIMTICSCTEKVVLNQDREDEILSLLIREPNEEFIAITCDKPWEQELSFPVIVKDNDRYILYYGTYTGLAGRDRYFALCVATSSDGKMWEKPNLGIYDFEGDYNTNIISYEIEGFSVTKEDDAYYLLSYSTDYYTKLYKSIDGIKFNQINTFNIPYCCDSSNQLLYDEKNKDWKIYLRSWYKSENRKITYNHTDSLYRNVSLAITDDIENFKISMSESPFYRWGGGFAACNFK